MGKPFTLCAVGSGQAGTRQQTMDPLDRWRRLLQTHAKWIKLTATAYMHNGYHCILQTADCIMRPVVQIRYTELPYSRSALCYSCYPLLVTNYTEPHTYIRWGRDIPMARHAAQHPGRARITLLSINFLLRSPPTPVHFSEATYSRSFLKYIGLTSHSVDARKGWLSRTWLPCWFPDGVLLIKSCWTV